MRRCAARLAVLSGALLVPGVVTATLPGSGHAQPQRYVYPLKVSSNRRYLVDQRGRPFMVVGDSPHSLIGNLSLKDAAAYIADRKAAGFNSLLVQLLCVKYAGCRPDGTNASGITPFTTPDDLATPNPAYFAHADAVIRLAAKANIVVFLDPIETGGWLGVLRRNGVQKDYAYGRFLGERYKRFGNIVWASGNDFQTWQNPSDDAVVLAVAKGIGSVDHVHLQTIELNYMVSASLDDPRWRSVVTLDSAYTYSPTYAEVLKEYDRSSFMPVDMIEAGYEFEQNLGSISYGNPDTLRRQEYWSMLAGATGQFYGNHYTWRFADGWKQHLDSDGSRQIGYLVKLFAGRPWFRLVPDQEHTLVTAGYGQPSAEGSVDSSDYVTAAATRDGRLAVAYLPDGGTITVDLARLKGPVRASWYDPTSGTYTSVPGAPFRSAGGRAFTAPGKNADGESDWLLVLTAA